jgi:hypothetical protein
VPKLPVSQKPFLDLKLHQFRVDFWNSFVEVISFVFGHGNFIPQDFEQYHTKIIGIASRIASWNPTDGDLEIDEEDSAILRHVVLSSPGWPAQASGSAARALARKLCPCSWAEQSPAGGRSTRRAASKPAAAT